MGPSVLWFRHGLRLHDNPALLEAVRNASVNNSEFYPIFIFDGETAGTKIIGYNRMKFLLESLDDLDKQFRQMGGQLYLFRGKPEEIFKTLIDSLNIKQICYEQDCEPIWQDRDSRVEQICASRRVRCTEKISHTLWNPLDVVRKNGGIPPLTYQMFLHTVQTIGLPPRPEPNPNWDCVKFGKIREHVLQHLDYLEKIPTPEELFCQRNSSRVITHLKWRGGETEALKNFENRLHFERSAFENGYYLPNQINPKLLGDARSLSAHLRYGCLSIRRFYWSIHDLYNAVQHNTNAIVKTPGGQHITGQLIWREYFYTMSVKNPRYAEVKENPICLSIPWAEPDPKLFEKWKTGCTGFPLVDASMRQLLAEGWLHHTLRNITATFLTRGGLWISWEHGLKHFLEHLLDADWSVCAGNWMWVSSSAFEKLLDSSTCTCPIALGRRIDPNGEYIKRYIPELKNIPKQFIHEPWKASSSVQESIGYGVHYPERMIDLQESFDANNSKMKILRQSLLSNGVPGHCRPSNDDEIRQFFWLFDEMK